MKIGIIISEGGHFIEALNLLDAFSGHDIFVITYASNHLLQFKDGRMNRIYFMPLTRRNYILILKLLLYSYRFFNIFRREKPDILFSTGSEIAIPAFVIGKLFFRTKLIFMETITKFNNASLTGRLLYFIADLFIVPWESLLKTYGARARFVGEVV